MAIITPWPMDALDGAPEYDATTLRAIFAALLGKGDTATQARAGVIDGFDVFMLDDVAYVEPGLAVVNTPDGSFITGIDEEAALGLVARHPTNPRTDRLVLQVLHSPTERTATLQVITGTPAPSPLAPPTPQNALSLGTITLPAASGPGSVFNAGQVYTAGRGGVIRVPTEGAMRRMADVPAYTEVVVENGSGAGKWIYVSDEWTPVTVDGVAGKRGGGPDVILPPGLTRFDPGPAVYLTGGVSVSEDRLIVPITGIYMVTAGLRLAQSPPFEVQLRVRMASTEVANQSIENARYLSATGMGRLGAGSSVDMAVYNNGSSDVTAIDGFGGHNLAVTLIQPLSSL